jgi:hypothetical protein
MPKNAGLRVSGMKSKTRTLKGSAEMSEKTFLPTTVADLLARRKTSRIRNINQDIEDIHLKLWEDEEYRKYMMVVWREEAVEGSYVADDFAIARYFRDYAIANDMHIAGSANLASIVRSLHWVWRNYRISRQERRQFVNDDDGADTAAA